jgi:antitoxin (DNA-binding transcriptional repressor) of toxin-antitoxin stability system
MAIAMAIKDDAMPHYSVATSKDKLSSLIDKALAGEEVVITRHGKPTVSLKIVAAEAPSRERDTSWYLAELAKLPPVVNGGKTLMQRIRDEYRY